MTLYIGWDPGTQGALAIISDKGEILRIVAFSKVSHPDLAAALERAIVLSDCCAVLEQVGSMPGEGVASVFKFGTTYGFAQGLLTAYRVPFDFVRPQDWQREFGLGKKYPTKSLRKNAHKQKAQQLFPLANLTLETCDALLIAEYCRRKNLNSRR